MDTIQDQILMLMMEQIINNLFTPSARTTNYGLKQIKVNGPRICNDLPTYLKNVTSLNVFSKNLKL